MYELTQKGQMKMIILILVKITKFVNKVSVQVKLKCLWEIRFLPLKL